MNIAKYIKMKALEFYMFKIKFYNEHLVLQINNIKEQKYDFSTSLASSAQLFPIINTGGSPGDVSEEPVT